MESEPKKSTNVLEGGIKKRKKYNSRERWLDRDIGIDDRINVRGGYRERYRY